MIPEAKRRGLEQALRSGEPVRFKNGAVVERDAECPVDLLIHRGEQLDRVNEHALDQIARAYALALAPVPPPPPRAPAPSRKLADRDWGPCPF